VTELDETLVGEVITVVAALEGETLVVDHIAG
jgi:hypothetical protein